MKMSESSRDKDKKPYDNNNLTMWEDSSKQAILAMGDIGDGLGEITGATEKAGEEIPEEPKYFAGQDYYEKVMASEETTSSA